MKQLRIYRPALEKAVHNSKSEYARQMIQHLQDTEDWQRTMHEAQTEGWGTCQLWTFIHRDGRIARLPDPCPTDKIRIASQKRQQQWIKLRLLAISLQFKNE